MFSILIKIFSFKFINYFINNINYNKNNNISKTNNIQNLRIQEPRVQRPDPCVRCPQVGHGHGSLLVQPQHHMCAGVAQPPDRHLKSHMCAGVCSAPKQASQAPRVRCGCPAPRQAAQAPRVRNFKGHTSSLALGACWLQPHTCPHQTVQFIVKALIVYNTHDTIQNSIIYNKFTYNK